MSASSDYAARMKSHQDKQDAAVAALTTDVAELNNQIAALQTSPGQITPDDQALLNDIEAKGKSLAEQLDALNSLVPPPAPPPE